MDSTLPDINILSDRSIDRSYLKKGKASLFTLYTLQIETDIS